MIPSSDDWKERGGGGGRLAGILQAYQSLCNGKRSLRTSPCSKVLKRMKWLAGLPVDGSDSTPAEKAA